ncbi:MAG: spore cortex biosynthesis protein YabQ [Clostridia bacterium]|nr:spore cortex biosynthesis protein YabQ [Clostridia bacterium]
MEVSQIALAQMLLSCFLCGIAMGFCYELLRLPRILLFGDLLPYAAVLQKKLTLSMSLRPISSRGHSCDQEESCRLPEESGEGQKGSRKKTYLSSALMAITDILFCLICAIVLILVLYATNHGEFRLVAPGALFIGILISRCTLSRVLACFMQVLYVIVRASIIHLVAIILYPFLKSGLAVWHISLPLRQRLAAQRRVRKEKRLQRADARREIRQNKRQRAKQTDQITEQPSPRPPHDGRRVFRMGGSHIHGMSK